MYHYRLHPVFSPYLAISFFLLGGSSGKVNMKKMFLKTANQNNKKSSCDE